MKSLGSFFEKFKSASIKEIQKRTTVSDIIKSEANIDVPMEKIVFANGVIKLKLSSIEKNQIFIKKERIIKLINQRLGNTKISSIE
jgi:hypothetical protein